MTTTIIITAAVASVFQTENLQTEIQIFKLEQKKNLQHIKTGIKIVSVLKYLYFSFFLYLILYLKAR